MNKVILVTGASSGFGRLTANALARSGHTVDASMRGTGGRNASQAEDVRKFAVDNKVDLRPLELDVSSQGSVDTGVAQILDEIGLLDVDGAAVAFAVIDRVREEMLHRVGFADLLRPRAAGRAAEGAMA